MRKLNTPTLHWREIPLFRLLLPFAVGIYVGELLPAWSFISFEILLLGGLVLFLLSRYSFEYAHRWIPGIVISSYLILLGAYWVMQFDERKKSNHFIQIGEEKQALIGRIISYPQSTKKYWKAVLKIEGIQQEKEVLPATGNLLVYFKKENASPLYYGDQVLLHTVPRVIPASKNPLAFNYKRYCHFQNLHYQSFLSPAAWKVIRSKQGPLLYQTAYEWQGYFKEVFQRSIPHPDAYAIISAMLLGDRTAISEDLEQLYKETGVLHVLAVSGLHVGILNELTLWLLALFRKKDAHWKRWQWIISMAVIWLFVVLVGSTTSVIRAAIMFSFLNLGRLLRISAHSLNSLAAAAFLILFYEPYALFQVGFQFSFLAVMGIIIFYKNLCLFWIPSNSIIHKIWKVLVVGVAAQLGVLPLLVYYFHQIPLYAFLVSGVVVFFASFLLYGGLGLLLLSTISWEGAAFIGKGISLLITCEHQFLQLIQQLPYTLWTAIWLSPYEVLLLYGAIISLGLVFITKETVYLKGVLIGSSLFLCCTLLKVWKNNHQLSIVIYDIPRKSMVDLVDGATIYAISKDTLTEEEEQYQLANFRIATATKIQAVSDTLHTPQLFLQRPYLQIGSKKMILLNKAPLQAKTPAKPLTIDYLLLQHSPSVTIHQLQQYYEFDKLLLDSSNDKQAVHKWKKSCQELGIAYHDTQEDGAFILELVKKK